MVMYEAIKLMQQWAKRGPAKRSFTVTDGGEGKLRVTLIENRSGAVEFPTSRDVRPEDILNVVNAMIDEIAGSEPRAQAFARRNSG